MDAERTASEAGRALAERRWGTPQEKARRRRAALLAELVRLERLEQAEAEHARRTNI
jgi:hypothetical protein